MTGLGLDLLRLPPQEQMMAARLLRLLLLRQVEQRPNRSGTEPHLQLLSVAAQLPLLHRQAREQRMQLVLHE